MTIYLEYLESVFAYDYTGLNLRRYIFRLILVRTHKTNLNQLT